LSQSPHDEFIELCAVSTSGQLTAEEQKRLDEHLAVCPSCREVTAQYDAVVGKAIPTMAPESDSVESDPSWSQEQAEAAFFRRLTLEEELGTDREGGGETAAKGVGRIPFLAGQATWRNVWTLYAAGVLLFIALGLSAYQVGLHRGVNTSATTPPANQQHTSALELQVSDAGHERELIQAQMAQRDRVIADLRHQLEQQSTEMSRMKIARSHLETDLEQRQAGRQALLQERSDVTRELDRDRTTIQSLQNSLDSLTRQSAEDRQRATALDAKLTDLNGLLRDREATIEQEQELLAHDRDIRDLMGARDLYVAEVYDVERTGETRKPYGRVFYTKGKSLIFYAYDLDQQAGVKSASTFQAWGRRGPDRQQALNLGVFYVDSASKKRWVLRFNDPKALAEIDAVFVTVEPNGGSQKPSKKPLLFAYLHIDPNHP
jgi:peptidoglycan hydrolase CwlO-like protein